MWTCGIDMATQQPMPATISTACKALGERPSERDEWAATPALPSAACCKGGGRRNTKASGTMTRRQTAAAIQ